MRGLDPTQPFWKRSIQLQQDLGRQKIERKARDSLTARHVPMKWSERAIGDTRIEIPDDATWLGMRRMLEYHGEQIVVG